MKLTEAEKIRVEEMLNNLVATRPYDRSEIKSLVESDEISKFRGFGVTKINLLRRHFSLSAKPVKLTPFQAIKKLEKSLGVKSPEAVVKKVHELQLR